MPETTTLLGSIKYKSIASTGVGEHTKATPGGLRLLCNLM